MSAMKLDLLCLSSERDRHGNDRLHVRRNGRRIRVREAPGTRELLTEAALMRQADTYAGEASRRKLAQNAMHLIQPTAGVH